LVWYCYAACEQPTPDLNKNNAATSPAPAAMDDYLQNYKVTREVKGVFEDISEDIKNAVIDRGLFST